MTLSDAIAAGFHPDDEDEAITPSNGSSDCSLPQNAEVSTALFENDVMVKRVIWIAGQLAKQSEDFEDFIDEIDDCIRLLGINPEDCDFEHEEIARRCAAEKLTGFLVQASVPEPFDFDESGSYRTGGLSRLKWFYFEDMKEAKDSLVNFSGEVFSNAQAEEKSAAS